MAKPIPPEERSAAPGLIRRVLPEVVVAALVTAILATAERVSQQFLLPSSALAIVAILVLFVVGGTDSRRRRRLFVLGAIASVVGFSAGAINGSFRSGRPTCDSPITDVVVVNKAIPQGALVTENDLLLVKVPTSYVVAEYVLDVDEAIGRIANYQIPQYSIVTDAMTSSRSEPPP